MLVILAHGGFRHGGINFDAKTRRNSTDLADIFIAHVTGMDAFARALVTADAVLERSPYRKFRAERYASFDSGPGAEFARGGLTLEDLHTIAHQSGEPAPRSGKQEWLESLINQYL